MGLTGLFNHWPKAILFGAGAVKQLGAEIKRLEKKNVVIVTDEGMKKLDIVQKVIDQLREEGFTVDLYGEIGPNPTDEMIHRGVEFLKKVSCDILVAMGGGSPIDAGKAMNIVYTHGGIINEYDLAVGGIGKITDKLLPFIAIPTTSGTASEVSIASVITDTKRKLKMSVISPRLVPTLAIVDPEMTVTMPPKLTAYTGMDTMTHLIEAYVSKHQFAPASGIALQGIKLASKSLRLAVFEGKNIEAREDMIMASMMGGLSFNHNMLGLVHAMAHQLSSFYHFPHGLANAMLLPLVMKYNMPVCLKQTADIAEAMGVNIKNMSLREAAEAAINEVEKLSRDIGIPKYIDEFGVMKDQIPEMVANALIDPVIGTNPRTASAEDIKDLYLAACKN